MEHPLQFKYRYIYYAMANQQTVESQQQLDLKQWSEGNETFGFQIWLHQAKTRYAQEFPDRLDADGKVVSETTFTRWIGEQVKEYLGL